MWQITVICKKKFGQPKWYVIINLCSDENVQYEPNKYDTDKNFPNSSLLYTLK